MSHQQRWWRVPVVLSFLILNLCADPAIDGFVDATNRVTNDISTQAQSDISMSNVSEVRYRLQWVYGKAVPLTSGQGWRVVTDSGYEVTVTKAAIISYRLQLVECDLSSSFTNYLGAFGGSQLAYAGHGDDTNLTTVDGPFVESLDSPVNVEAVGLFPGNQAFCQLHYLVSGKGSESQLTLSVEGTFQREGGDAQAFELLSTQNHGNLVELPQVKQKPGHAIVVQVTRNLGQLFDNVNFEQDSDNTMTWRILDSLVNSLEIEVL